MRGAFSRRIERIAGKIAMHAVARMISVSVVSLVTGLCVTIAMSIVAAMAVTMPIIAMPAALKLPGFGSPGVEEVADITHCRFGDVNDDVVDDVDVDVVNEATNNYPTKEG